VFQVALFTPTPKAAKRVLEIFSKINSNQALAMKGIARAARKVVETEGNANLPPG
jgi:hypothetical protein